MPVCGGIVVKVLWRLAERDVGCVSWAVVVMAGRRGVLSRNKPTRLGWGCGGNVELELEVMTEAHDVSPHHEATPPPPRLAGRIGRSAQLLHQLHRPRTVPGTPLLIHFSSSFSPLPLLAVR